MEIGWIRGYGCANGGLCCLYGLIGEKEDRPMEVLKAISEGVMLALALLYTIIIENKKSK